MLSNDRGNVLALVFAPIRLIILAVKAKTKFAPSGQQQQWHSSGFSIKVFVRSIFLLSCLIQLQSQKLKTKTGNPFPWSSLFWPNWCHCPMRFRTITHVFGEVGHTHNAVDQRLSVASTIFSNQRTIETPADPSYYELVSFWAGDRGNSNSN